MTFSRREKWVFVMVALLGAMLVTRLFVTGPGYTDVYYHLNAATRLASGEGLTDAYLWTYIGAPDTLPAPSHLYWLPLTSVIAALGMRLLDAPGNYGVAQLPFTIMFAGTVYVGFWLGGRLGGSRRHAWIAGLVTLFSGFYVRFWGAIDTFAPYALAGSLCLALLGLGAQTDHTQSFSRMALSFALAGVFAGLAHLTRADGVLLLVVGWACILWLAVVERRDRFALLLASGILLTAAYALVMLPWFIRNWNAIGSPMPLGGAQTIWLTSYDDIFSYPPDSAPATFFAEGINTLFTTRWEALSNNLGTFVAVEGFVVMTPLMLVGLWLRRRDSFLQGFWLYALGLHITMTFVFPFPGYRGGLLHSAAALVPWWAALGSIGLDATVEWIARRRRRWTAGTAKTFFSAGLVGIAVCFSVVMGLQNRSRLSIELPLYDELAARLPSDARVMINDPAQLYYQTGLAGVVLPNEMPDVIPTIARQYKVGYLLIEGITPDGLSSEAASFKLWTILQTPPDFLIPVPFDVANARLYEIRY
jgi:hypothetical protein